MFVFVLVGSVDTINQCTVPMKKDFTLEMVTVSNVIYKFHLTAIMWEQCIYISIPFAVARYRITQRHVNQGSIVVPHTAYDTYW